MVATEGEIFEFYISRLAENTLSGVIFLFFSIFSKYRVENLGTHPYIDIPTPKCQPTPTKLPEIFEPTPT